MNNPLFSIVIPTYNRGNLIGRCIDSIIAQTYTNWEAIIVDNYSDDNTEEVVLSYKDDRIRFIKNHNYGVIAVSRNKALDMAKGDWICFLDSDDAWFPNKLQEIKNYLKDYDLIYHNYQKVYPDTICNKNQYSKFYEIKESTVNYVIQRGDPINPSCACVSRDVIGDTRFDESRDLFAVEDYDFFLQLIHKNIRIKFLGIPLTLYDMSGCSHNEAASKRDLYVFNKWKYLLNEKEQKEFMRFNAYRKACYLMSTKQYKEANEQYAIACCARISLTRIKAIKGFIRSFYNKLKARHN